MEQGAAKELTVSTPWALGLTTVDETISQAATVHTWYLGRSSSNIGNRFWVHLSTALVPLGHTL
ncbi:hypothetical protein VFPFJ_09004 [Purpureocillium lilacinum]|uniref:Uncharacterized protein n=1 Tax=Purpureocillium lilacinum TaxID=33203 RepID=A0A179GFA1_PURLI|nr:hypothetical protein VFPFJ_09004 [Purpureocillium lilacinum]OAQ76051.1 hypothetical protein VFPBJ_08411 [Purpureocillium lilacinum]OAQ83201.1 hypothetical protein VFPFJ_09004 [Purpureocillium lilacinum]